MTATNQVSKLIAIDQDKKWLISRRNSRSAAITKLVRDVKETVTDEGVFIRVAV